MMLLLKGAGSMLPWEVTHFISPRVFSISPVVDAMSVDWSTRCPEPELCSDSQRRRVRVEKTKRGKSRCL